METMDGRAASSQVADDPALLDLMVDDLRGAPELYKPGNYWANYERILIPELHTIGLHDFRRRRGSVLHSFGATDFSPVSAALNTHPMNPHPRTRSRVKRVLLEAVRRVEPASRALASLSGSLAGASLRGVRSLVYEVASLYGEVNGARPLADFCASTVGNPDDVFEVEGRTYTTTVLQYYIQYAYCCRFVDFGGVGSIMELGSGVGKQVEVLRKLHPNLSFYLFDIPPQLYVCEQFLSAVFPGSVVSYRDGRGLKRLPEPVPGRIHLFGTWKIPELEDLGCDLFWNSASFQEMEPSLVLNYLSYVNRVTRRHVYLQESMTGMPQARRPGEHGVLQKTTLEHYEQGLPDFVRVDLRDAIDLELLRTGRKSPYSFSFWNRRDG